MKANFLLMMGLFVATLIGLSACSDDNEPAIQDDGVFVLFDTRTLDGEKELVYSYDADGKLKVENAKIPTLKEYETEIDFHAWKLISSNVILPDGSFKPVNERMIEGYWFFNGRRMAFVIYYSFNSELPRASYFNIANYNEKTGSNGTFFIAKLSEDHNTLITINETSYYPDPHGKMVHGYEQMVFERLTADQKDAIMQKYNISQKQLDLQSTEFEPSNGKDLFGAKIQDLSFEYMEPGFSIATYGIKQISESVFKKHIVGYGWKCESAHEINLDGSINPEEYIYNDWEWLYHYYFGKDKYTIFSIDRNHNDTPYFYDEKYEYEERDNTFFEINDGKRVGGKQIVALGDDLKSFYVLGANHANDLSSDSHDQRFNLTKYVRLTDDELKEMREKHHTNFWDLYKD